MKLFLNTSPYKSCFYIDGNMNDEDKILVENLISNGNNKFLPDNKFLESHIEIGPRKNFKTSWNSNVCQILKRCGVQNLNGIEFTNFYPKDFKDYDRILFEDYSNKDLEIEKEDIFNVEDIAEFNINKNLGLDEQDIDYYEDIFSNLGRNPTNIELYDLSQCNSEHARHWFLMENLKLKIKY